jgi:nucleoside phosphorylase
MGPRRSEPLLDFEDYTVVWIAPLEIEAQAALHMLDNIHEGYFPSSYGDDYTYLAGDINKLNIVIATLPPGYRYGVSAAASLATQVRKDFPNIWFGLLVGVAAGLPNLRKTPPDDIRLGDVLVGLGAGDRAGIVNYDFGKETDNGFEVMPLGTQARTSRFLSSKINRIKLLSLLSQPFDNSFEGYYQQIKDKTHGNGNFADPGQDKDQLYQTTYNEDNTVNETKLVERKARPLSARTAVWYGSIGSGDTLMRSAKKRDELRDKFDLIGLEMEAAGTIDRIPVAVIRGVSDYGDAQKNKEWQPYAAAMAAAYAKHLLNTITPAPGQGNQVLNGRKAVSALQITSQQSQ